MNETKTVTVETPEFLSWYEGVVKINRDYMGKEFPTNQLDPFSFRDGKKYIKVVRGGGVHCFLDKTNGDVLKAAGWNAPARHARGNIFDDKNGLGMMNQWGPDYLR